MGLFGTHRQKSIRLNLVTRSAYTIQYKFKPYVVQGANHWHCRHRKKPYHFLEKCSANMLARYSIYEVNLAEHESYVWCTQQLNYSLQDAHHNCTVSLVTRFPGEPCGVHQPVKNADLSL